MSGVCDRDRAGTVRCSKGDVACTGCFSYRRDVVVARAFLDIQLKPRAEAQKFCTVKIDPAVKFTTGALIRSLNVLLPAAYLLWQPFAKTHQIAIKPTALCGVVCALFVDARVEDKLLQRHY